MKDVTGLPTYDMRCEECGHRFELFLTRIVRSEDKVCPSCGSESVRTGIGGGILGAGTRSASNDTCVPRGGFT